MHALPLIRAQLTVIVLQLRLRHWQDLASLFINQLRLLHSGFVLHPLLIAHWNVVRLTLVAVFHVLVPNHVVVPFGDFLVANWSSAAGDLQGVRATRLSDYIVKVDSLAICLPFSKTKIGYYDLIAKLFEWTGRDGLPCKGFSFDAFSIVD
jgi:hypothetical protein